MSNFNIIRQDIKTIIEIIDLMKYAADHYPLVINGLTAPEKKLVNDLSGAIEEYRAASKECVV